MTGGPGAPPCEDGSCLTPSGAAPDLGGARAEAKAEGEADAEAEAALGLGAAAAAADASGGGGDENKKGDGGDVARDEEDEDEDDEDDEDLDVVEDAEAMEGLIGGDRSYRRPAGGDGMGMATEGFTTKFSSEAEREEEGEEEAADGARRPPRLEPYTGKLERFELFSTAQCYYLVACDKAGSQYRVLKVDRTLIERPDFSARQAHQAALAKAQPPSPDAPSEPPAPAPAPAPAPTPAPAPADLPPPSPPAPPTTGVFPATAPSAHNQPPVSGPTDAPHGSNAAVRPLAEFCIEDPAVYGRHEIRDMMDMIHEGNRYTPGYDAPHGGAAAAATSADGRGDGRGGTSGEAPGGGLRPICKAYGVVGFVRFLDCYYLTLITKRAKVGSLGGNGVYTIKATETFPLKPADRPGGGAGERDPGAMLLSMWNRGKRSVGLGLTNREIAELRYQGLYQVVDLTKNFYFSYTYDITRSLQENFLAAKKKPFPPPKCKDMYAWNFFLTRELEQCTNSLTSFHWVLPIVHGAFLQRRLNDYGRCLNLTLLARRSRHFAGTRYLKRGVSDLGKVANDVEHEQVLHDESASASAGAFSSYLQMRGSIPTFWTQESSVTMPKPPIVLNRVDPTYHATQAHFADLLCRYGSPIVVVDLVKQSEKREREVIVGNEYRSAIDYLNCHIVAEHKIRYCALDYSHISKHRNLNVSTSLNETATWAVNQTGFFCSFPRWTINEEGRVEPFDDELAEAKSRILDHYVGVPVLPMEQKGVLRTNCIDCLDRTNVAQFSAGVEALGQQLVVMGIRNTAKLDPSSNIVRVFIDMFVEIGDHIALQYGGSEAHKKVNTTAGPAANIQGPMGKHKELLTSIKRYYSNAFSDRLRQDAMNLFLGYYIPSLHTVPLWELESDYYLHNFHIKSGRGSLQSMKLHQKTFGVDWSDDQDDKLGQFETTSVTQSGRNGKGKEESWRIERVRRRCRAQDEALSVWWRVAIQGYIKQRIWSNLGRPSDALLPSRFERIYQPDKLAVFDDFLSRTWAAPVRLSHSAQHSHAGDDNADLMVYNRKDVVPAKQKAGLQQKDLADSNTEAREESILDFFNTNGFASNLTPSMRLFLSSHEAHHRSLQSTQGHEPESKKEEVQLEETLSEKSSVKSSELTFLGDLTAKSDPCREYLDYAAFSTRLHPCDQKSRPLAREEFTRCLEEINLSSDDVEGIRKLAESAHICSEIKSGPYQGLRETDSAVGVTAVIHEQLNNIDNMRRRGEGMKGSLPGVDDDLRQRRMDKASVKDAIYKDYANSIRAEEAYSEIIDTSSLGCRRSDFSDEKSMKLYCSFFDQATPLSRLDMTYLMGNGPHKDKPNTKERTVVGGLKIECTKPSNRRSTSLFPEEGRPPIPEGFEQINDDMFARKDNRFMVFNGTGLDSWTGSQQPKTKVNGLEDDILVGFGFAQEKI